MLFSRNTFALLYEIITISSRLSLIGFPLNSSIILLTNEGI